MTPLNALDLLLTVSALGVCPVHSIYELLVIVRGQTSIADQVCTDLIGFFVLAVGLAVHGAPGLYIATFCLQCVLRLVRVAVLVTVQKLK